MSDRNESESKKPNAWLGLLRGLLRPLYWSVVLLGLGIVLTAVGVHGSANLLLALGLTALLYRWVRKRAESRLAEPTPDQVDRLRTLRKYVLRPLLWFLVFNLVGALLTIIAVAVGAREGGGILVPLLALGLTVLFFRWSHKRAESRQAEPTPDQVDRLSR